MSAGSWFLLLLGVCMIGRYVLGVRPKTKNDWHAIAATIAFLIWMLGMIRLVSR